MVSRTDSVSGGDPEMFQSRNRGSFGFKICRPEFQSRNRGSFGLCQIARFQSRNRGSFGFKQGRPFQSRNRFNLVIEVLLISSPRTLFGGFNLGIEVLLVSSSHWSAVPLRLLSFNLAIEVLLISRGAPSEVLRYVLSVVAIPRATHFERRGDHRKIRRIGSKHGS